MRGLLFLITLCFFSLAYVQPALAQDDGGAPKISVETVHKLLKDYNEEFKEEALANDSMATNSFQALISNVYSGPQEKQYNIEPRDGEGGASGPLGDVVDDTVSDAAKEAAGGEGNGKQDLIQKMTLNTWVNEYQQGIYMTQKAEKDLASKGAQMFIALNQVEPAMAAGLSQSMNEAHNAMVRTADSIKLSSEFGGLGMNEREYKQLFQRCIEKQRKLTPKESDLAAIYKCLGENNPSLPDLKSLNGETLDNKEHIVQKDKEELAEDAKSGSYNDLKPYYPECSEYRYGDYGKWKYSVSANIMKGVTQDNEEKYQRLLQFYVGDIYKCYQPDFTKEAAINGGVKIDVKYHEPLRKETRLGALISDKEDTIGFKPRRHFEIMTLLHLYACEGDEYSIPDPTVDADPAASHKFSKLEKNQKNMLAHLSVAGMQFKPIDFEILLKLFKKAEADKNLMCQTIEQYKQYKAAKAVLDSSEGGAGVSDNLKFALTAVKKYAEIISANDLNGVIGNLYGIVENGAMKDPEYVRMGAELIYKASGMSLANVVDNSERLAQSFKEYRERLANYANSLQTQPGGSVAKQAGN